MFLTNVRFAMLIQYETSYEKDNKKENTSAHCKEKKQGLRIKETDLN